MARNKTLASINKRIDNAAALYRPNESSSAYWKEMDRIKSEFRLFFNDLVEIKELDKADIILLGQLVSKYNFIEPFRFIMKF